MFTREAAPTDPLTEARVTVDKLAAALAEAEGESADARISYDREMHEHVARGIGKDQPSQDPQRSAEAKLFSLKRLLVDARERMAGLTREADDARRHAAIQASGSLVAELTTTAEAKVAAFVAAVDTVKRAEAELFDALFDERAGLKQELADPAATKDAFFCRRRLAKKAIAVAEASRNVRVDCRFEIDGEPHAGHLEDHFYRRPLSAKA